MSRDITAARFPNVAWAWPPVKHHQLLGAALNPDKCEAMHFLRDWLDENELDDASFPEHRLLAAVATRLGKEIETLPEYGRLVGIQRLNWTKSRMAIKDIRPILESFTNAGLKVVLLKGASRVALDPGEQKSRTSYDVDVLLASDEFTTGFDLLSAAGWKSARGESPIGLRARLSSVRARNFKKGKFGDLDLHRIAYKPENASVQDDQQLFKDASPVSYYGLPCFVPSAEERLAIAVAHGGLSADSHSDWIVDCARIIEYEQIDWQKLRGILKRRHLSGHAEIAFGYLQNGLQIGMNDVAESGFGQKTGWMPLSQINSLIVARHPARMGMTLRAVRKLIIELRKARSTGRNRSGDTPRFLAVFRRSPGFNSAVETVAGISGQDAGFEGPGRYHMTLELEVNTASARRRAEFELNSATQNICSLKALAIRNYSGPGTIRFSGRISLGADGNLLFLNALPGKYLDGAPSSNELAAHAPLPFSVSKFQLRRTGAVSFTPLGKSGKHT